jgi:hypothetical protein
MKKLFLVFLLPLLLACPPPTVNIVPIGNPTLLASYQPQLNGDVHLILRIELGYGWERAEYSIGNPNQPDWQIYTGPIEINVSQPPHSGGVQFIARQIDENGNRSGLSVYHTSTEDVGAPTGNTTDLPRDRAIYYDGINGEPRMIDFRDDGYDIYYSLNKSEFIKWGGDPLPFPSEGIYELQAFQMNFFGAKSDIKHYWFGLFDELPSGYLNYYDTSNISVIYKGVDITADLLAAGAIDSFKVLSEAPEFVYSGQPNALVHGGTVSISYHVNDHSSQTNYWGGIGNEGFGISDASGNFTFTPGTHPRNAWYDSMVPYTGMNPEGGFHYYMDSVHGDGHTTRKIYFPTLGIFQEGDYDIPHDDVLHHQVIFNMPFTINPFPAPYFLVPDLSWNLRDNANVDDIVSINYDNRHLNFGDAFKYQTYLLDLIDEWQESETGLWAYYGYGHSYNLKYYRTLTSQIYIDGRNDELFEKIEYFIVRHHSNGTPEVVGYSYGYYDPPPASHRTELTSKVTVSGRPMYLIDFPHIPLEDFTIGTVVTDLAGDEHVRILCRVFTP